MMSKWKYVEYDWALNLFFHGENPYWWGAVNIEYCKSAENKRCLLAYYRARKNKARRIIQRLKPTKFSAVTIFIKSASALFLILC